MKAIELIVRSMFLAGIGSRGFNQSDSQEAKDGLFFLRLIMKEKSITGDYIPYYSHLNGVFVPSQESYFIANLTSVETASYSIQGVRYSINNVNRDYYFGAPRVNNVPSLPYMYYWERTNGGAQIYFYFLPKENWQFQVTGKLDLQDVNYDDELNDFFDEWFQSYLMFELANRYCQFYLMTLNPSVAEQLEIFKVQLRTINPLDLTLQKTSTLSGYPTFNYALANWPGWVT